MADRLASSPVIAQALIQRHHDTSIGQLTVNIPIGLAPLDSIEVSVGKIEKGLTLSVRAWPMPARESSLPRQIFSAAFVVHYTTAMRAVFDSGVRGRTHCPPRIWSEK